MTLTPGRRALLGGVLTLAVSIAARWSLIGFGVLQPVFSPDTASFIDYANTWMRTGTLPPTQLRLPGYPLFLIITAGPGGHYARTMLAQQGLGIVSTLLCYALVLRLTGRVWLALAAVAINVLLVDVLLMEIVLYAETLTGVLVNTGALALAYGFTRRTSQTGWFAAAGLAWTAAAYSRPVHLASLAALLGIVLVARWRREIPWAPVVATCATTVLIVAAYVGYNAARDGTGRPSFAAASGLSLLNYLAYPQMYRNLPSSMADVQVIYEEKAPTVPLGYVWWWTVLPSITQLKVGQGADPRSTEAIAFQTAITAIRARPLIYLSIWSGTLRRFLSSYDLQHGLLISNQRPPTPDNIQLAPAAYQLARRLERVWQVLMPILSACALLLPPLALIRLDDPRSRAMLALWIVAVAIVLAGVSVEPFSRQARYRIPIQHLLVALAVAGAQAAPRARRA